MAIFVKIRDLEKRVGEELESLGLPANISSSLSDAIYKHIILKGTENHGLTYETYLVATAQVILEDQIKDQDVATIVGQMIYRARERSHGSAILSKAFVNEEVYKQLLEEFGGNKNTVCMVQKVRILPASQLPHNYVLGICSPQNDYVPAKMLVLGGFIERVSDASK